MCLGGEAGLVCAGRTRHGFRPVERLVTELSSLLVTSSTSPTSRVPASEPPETGTAGSGGNLRGLTTPLARLSAISWLLFFRLRIFGLELFSFFASLPAAVWLFFLRKPNLFRIPSCGAPRSSMNHIYEIKFYHFDIFVSRPRYQWILRLLF